jgi:hypothetical protein
MTARFTAGPRDTGSISAFVVSLFAVFVVAAALVVDGGRFVAARTNAADAAENAARAGAQHVRQLRDGRFVLDPSKASSAARAFLAGEGVSGSVAVNDRTVTVTVRASVAPAMLGLVGVGSRSITVTRRATALDR